MKQMWKTSVFQFKKIIFFSSTNEKDEKRMKKYQFSCTISFFKVFFIDRWNDFFSLTKMMFFVFFVDETSFLLLMKKLLKENVSSDEKIFPLFHRMMKFFIGWWNFSSFSSDEKDEKTGFSSFSSVFEKRHCTQRWKTDEKDEKQMFQMCSL